MENENVGQGGSYLLDPKTGQRKLLQRTQPAQPTHFNSEVVTDDSEDKPTRTAGKD